MMGNWDVELEPNKNRVKTELDTISREAVKELYYKDGYIDFHKICELPSAQPEPSEITDEQAILHLQSTGWIQNHDREMYESGLREKLADDSGSYDSLIPCKDAVSLGVFEQVMWERDVAIEQLKELGYGFGEKPRTWHWIVLSATDMCCSECNELEHLDTSRKFCAYCGTRMSENPTGLESKEQV